MENAEEIMHSLEEFAKFKPKDIPKELDDYLGYVAKTGDPVFKWSIIKCLFREKLVNVITDFYESTLTIELPPCPNVDVFNYERMKANLLERIDSFHGAPFTVQRISELLTNPRKEYNRADKFMRAIEKNILVVSTREPGRHGEDGDGQGEASYNGMPYSREPLYVSRCNDSVDPDSSSQEFKVNSDTPEKAEAKPEEDDAEKPAQEEKANEENSVTSPEKEEAVKSEEKESVICSTVSQKPEQPARENEPSVREYVSVEDFDTVFALDPEAQRDLQRYFDQMKEQAKNPEQGDKKSSKPTSENVPQEKEPQPEEDKPKEEPQVEKREVDLECKEPQFSPDPVEDQLVECDTSNSADSETSSSSEKKQQVSEVSSESEENEVTSCDTSQPADQSQPDEEAKQKDPNEREDSVIHTTREEPEPMEIEESPTTTTKKHEAD
ncbi:serine/threonine-protein phosphatase 4 regulatory subunit 2 [Cimex lectularius]|uniref:Serine/threonine-protein phosphatase 4 regulatory subunit 2 n=1 Tax=Cimex lectularius TaxID=79782 RepID=A0A8I6TB76_CIMLE|nr:serine/threonine-protein phosphatase 4 regulatory subunit 2 [Cimex lectularius]